MGRLGHDPVRWPGSRACDNHPMSTAPATEPFGPGGLRRPKNIAIPREWYRTSNWYGVRGVASIFGVLLLALASWPWVVARGWWWAAIIVTPILGAYIYKLTIVLHECSHRTLFSSRTANVMVGRACAGLLGVSYEGFTTSHMHHHRHCGTNDETGEGDYLKLQGASPGQMAAHLLRPLAGVAYFQAFREYVRPHAPASSGAGFKARGRTRFWVDIGAIVLMQGMVAIVATGMGRHWGLVVVYPLTAATFGLFFSRVRAFCEHVSSLRLPGQCFVRSHMPNPLDRLLFYTLNMNLHVEHHLYPQVPACQLWNVRAQLRESGYLQPEMTSTSILRTIRECLAEARAARLAGGTRVTAA